MSKTFTGTVTSTRMKHTIVVQVERRFRHKKYGKVLTKHKKYHAHNQKNDIKEGDTVKISETKPMSKTVHFIVVEKVSDKK